MKSFRFVISASCACLLFAAVANAKPTNSRPSLPGDVVSSAEGTIVILEQGRSLRWSALNSVALVDKGNQVVKQVHLSDKGVKQSGAEALGLDVEESDLGGSMSSKAYLTGKKKPRGRAFDKTSLGGAAGGGQKQELNADGVAISILNLPNGASEWSFNWPGGERETLYFDKRKTFVVSERTRQVSGLTYRLKQWSEGSYARHYENAAGAVTVTFDTNDSSYQVEFYNKDGETLASLSCGESCSPQ